MFVAHSMVAVAEENYCDVVDIPIDCISRKNSIASYNFPQKTMFFSHVNQVNEELNNLKTFKLFCLTAVSSSGQTYEVVCDESTEVAVSRGRYNIFVKVSDLRSSSSLLIDSKGFLCKIVSIEPYTGRFEDKLFDVRSNKGNSKFVNGLMFRA